MLKLFNHRLRPMWSKTHWVSIGPRISFVVRSMLVRKKVIKADI